jgi:opacity protein-like surface antigen
MQGSTQMKIRLSCLALGLALAAPAAAPAAAADWTRGAGGWKDHGRAPVRVPAPVPVPDYPAKWYFRADIGLGLASDPGVSERGIVYGNSDPLFPVGTSRAWFDDDLGTLLTGGAGVGYYWTPQLRTDLTVDLRSDEEVKMRGTLHYDEYKLMPAPGGPIGSNVIGRTGNTVVGPTEDDTTLRSGVVLFNGYFDLSRGDRLTPYVGAGIGFVVNELERTHETTEYSCNPLVNPACTLRPGPLTPNAAYRADDTEHTVTLAAAAMAGVSYHLTSSTSLDVNYRYLFLGGTDATLSINGRSSRVEIGDLHEHQLRIGLRWDIE